MKGIGPRRAEQLGAHGIQTVRDLLDYPPFRYEDRTSFHPIRSLREGEWVLIRGEIRSLGGFVTARRGFSIIEMIVSDASGSVLLKFFNQPYLQKVYRRGMQIVIYGQVRRDEYQGGVLSLHNPECEILDGESTTSVHSGRVVPIYRKLGDLRSRSLRQILFNVVTHLRPDLSDPLPTYLRKQYRLVTRREALALVHFPTLRSSEPAARAKELEAMHRGLSPAHKRLIFEEFFQFQVGVCLTRRHRAQLRKDRTIRLGDPVRRAIKKILPYHPTAAQKRVLREIADDMCSARLMTRLLQGDVGSGKTIVAAQAAIIAVENGLQVAFMAPTEILAEQHYFNLRRLLLPLEYRLGLLKGGLRAKEKRATQEAIQSGEVQIAIGTHALLQEDVEFRNLALVIVDEQHRFGVVQRDHLRKKGQQADMLVMTATPIPRSLALTLYGDLEVSLIDEMPPGRKPIETRWISEKDRKEVYEELRRTVAAGGQAYVVYPLVEESEKTDLRAAVEMAEHLRSKIFPDLQIGLLHGRMKSGEKDRVMSAFLAGEIQILVSTTVIEVGVDVPNARLMVVEHAERFGLAQLHQLRGRVGRGSSPSRCILVGNVKNNPEAERRLQILCETNDGFRISEVDLELRGPGEFAGTRQSGIPFFKYANLVRDRKALEVARVEAERFLQKLSSNPDEECRQVAALIRAQWRSRYGFVLAG